MSDTEKKDDKTFDPAFGLGQGEMVNPKYGEADENGFVGVSPEYANFANDADAPDHTDADTVDAVSREQYGEEYGTQKTDDNKDENKPPAKKVAPPAPAK